MKINNRILNYIYLHFTFLLYSCVGVLSKNASRYQVTSIDFIIRYLIILSILFVYAFLWQKILKRFTLVTAYSNKGIVIFWTLLWSTLFFGETINLFNILGGIIIISGIVMIIKDDE